MNSESTVLRTVISQAQPLHGRDWSLARRIKFIIDIFIEDILNKDSTTKFRVMPSLPLLDIHYRCFSLD